MKTLKNASGVYVVRIQTEHGRRTISTGSTNFGEAQKMIRQAKVKELEQTAQTIRLTKEVVAQIVSGRKVRVREALKEWQSWMEGSHKPKRTTLNNVMVVQSWAREMKMEDATLTAVSEKDISRWINEPGAETKASWRAVKLSCVRRFFDFCSIRNYCMGDPSKLVRVDWQQMSHAQKERREAQVYAAGEIQGLLDYTRGRRLAEEARMEEAEKFLAELPKQKLRQTERAGQDRKWEGILEKAKEWRDYWRWWEFAVVFGRWTGLRLGDICQLEWDCFKAEKVAVWTDKRDRRVELPMEPEMAAVWEAVKKERASKKYLFPERREQALDEKKRAGLSVEFARLSKKAGVTGHNFHDLRATYCTEQDRAGVPIEHIRRAAGHERVEMTRRYIK